MRGCDLRRLRDVVQEREEEYRHQAEITIQLLLAELLDREAVEQQYEREREAFESYRTARAAFLAALAASEQLAA